MKAIDILIRGTVNILFAGVMAIAAIAGVVYAMPEAGTQGRIIWLVIGGAVVFVAFMKVELSLAKANEEADEYIENR